MTYYEKHREKIIAQVMKWQRENKTRHLAAQRITQRAARRRRPLVKRLRNIKQRCTCRSDPSYKYYGGKGVKCLLTAEDLEFMWARDLGEFMRRPSIHRIDSDGDYVLSNCVFMELSAHMKIHRKKNLTNPIM